MATDNGYCDSFATDFDTCVKTDEENKGRRGHVPTPEGVKTRVRLYLNTSCQQHLAQRAKLLEECLTLLKEQSVLKSHPAWFLVYRGLVMTYNALGQYQKAEDIVDTLQQVTALVVSRLRDATMGLILSESCICCIGHLRYTMGTLSSHDDFVLGEMWRVHKSSRRLLVDAYDSLSTPVQQYLLQNLISMATLTGQYMEDKSHEAAKGFHDTILGACTEAKFYMFARMMMFVHPDTVLFSMKRHPPDSTVPFVHFSRSFMIHFMGMRGTEYNLALWRLRSQYTYRTSEGVAAARLAMDNFLKTRPYSDVCEVLPKRLNLTSEVSFYAFLLHMESWATEQQRLLDEAVTQGLLEVQENQKQQRQQQARRIRRKKKRAKRKQQRRRAAGEEEESVEEMTGPPQLSEVDEAEEEEEECIVCLGLLGQPEHEVVLGCSHVFHRGCVELWGVKCDEKGWAFTCPTCRRPL